MQFLLNQLHKNNLFLTIFRAVCLTSIYNFRHKVVTAGAGRSHSMVVTEDGLSYAFGWNKHGQLGSGSIKNGEHYFQIYYGVLNYDCF